MWTFTIAVAIATMCLPRTALADPPAQSLEFSVNDARVRFERGVEFFLEGSYDAAFAEFSKAYQISPNYRVLYNLAQVQNLRHDYVAALSLFDDYLKQGGGDIPDDRRIQVENAVAGLKARVATITITGTPGSELLIDDQPVGRLPTATPVLVNPGKHWLQFRKAGYETVKHQLTIASAETVRIEVPLRPLVHAIVPRALAPAAASGGERTAAPLAAAAPARGERSSNAPMWTSLIAMTAFTGGAVTFGLLAERADDELGPALLQVPTDRGKVEDMRGRVERNAVLCDVLSAGAILSAGFFLYFAFSGSGAEDVDPNPSGVIASPAGIALIERF